MKKMPLISVSIVVLDQLIKCVIRQYPPGSVLLRLPGVFEVVHTENTGAAFSILAGKNIIIILLSVTLVIALATFVFRSMNLTVPGHIAMYCLIGGGAGNLIDRLIFGRVTDYIRLLFVNFAIFNVADIAITLSIAVLLILLFSNKLERKSLNTDGTSH